ncbi:transcriptional regulator with XRE-family HTH domain [Kitasatospora sp. MAA4]|uniref:XRE family transcriptional regulator n=1 Tax=Kitasatospora sp. MAA4 TaxID=3035093 RepID=UPI002475C59E|nr:XRE family transcriptional regulator [Kitasatospora sp. MAA4]MDH6133562.1 transcriptional regulator with XRE-family HTH domain [Kitasatospora sp. MAA4]
MSERQPDLREIIAGLLDDERLLSACRDRDMGRIFRLLQLRGASTRRIAGAVEITQGRLYDYMNGRTRVEKLTMFEQIADAFHIPGQLLGLARRPWEQPATSPRQFPASGATADADDLTAMDAFRHADRQSGGGRLYGAVVHHLSSQVAPRLVNIASGPQVFAAAAALTEMAGWMAHDSGIDDLAHQHFARALPLARASGDFPLAAHIAASTSHLALQTDDAAEAAHWALAGLDFSRGGPHLPSLSARLHTMQARALAATGQITAAERALGKAEHALTERAQDAHPWLSPFDEATLASESALAYQDLGRLDTAFGRAEHAVALREESRARSLALSRITLARIHAKRKDLGSAVGVGHQLLATCASLGSIRVVRQLDDLRRLLEQHLGYTPVREYLALFDDARRTRMLLLADIVPPSRGGSS